MVRVAATYTVYADRESRCSSRVGFRFTGKPYFLSGGAYINIPYSYPHYSDTADFPTMNFTVLPYMIGEVVEVPDCGNRTMEYIGFAEHPSDPSKSVVLYCTYPTVRDGAISSF